MVEPGDTTRVRVWAVPFVLLYGLLLAAMLFSPTATVQTRMVMHATDLVGPYLPVGWATFTRAEAVLNAVIIAPLTFLGSLAFPRMRWSMWTALGFLGALAVETLQGLFLTGRQARFSDVVANTLGACLGAAASLLLQWAVCRRAQARPSSR